MTESYLAIGVCVFFAYNTSTTENKKQVNEKQDQPPKDVICLRKICSKMSSFDW